MIPRIAVPATPIQNCRSRADRINFYGLREEIETNDHPATVKMLAKFTKPAGIFQRNGQPISNIPPITRLNQPIPFLPEAERCWPTTLPTTTDLTDSKSNFTRATFVKGVAVMLQTNHAEI